MRRVVFFSLLGIFFLYTGLHAQRLWPAHPLLGWAGDLSFVGLMVVWQRVHRADQSDPESWRYRILAWSGTIAMGIWATFLFFCLAMDLFGLVLLIAQWIRPFPFNSQALHLPAILALLSAGFAVMGLVQAVQGPRVVRVRVPIEGLPAALQGLKIALLSDLTSAPRLASVM
jgi:uncharacterized protein